MSPTAVAALFLLALVIDYLSIGPNSIRDRVAFCFAVVAWRVGFNGSQLDRWTVERLSAFINYGKSAAGDAYIANAVTSAVIGLFVGVLFIYTIGCLLPDKFSKRLGRVAAMALPTTGIHRLNYKLWGCAFALGVLGDLPNGWVGQLAGGFVDLLTTLVTPVPNIVFGVR